MNECDHTIALDGIEHSLWDARIDCPYCRIAELEAQVERLERALHNKCRKLELAEGVISALEGEQDG